MNPPRPGPVAEVARVPGRSRSVGRGGEHATDLIGTPKLLEPAPRRGDRRLALQGRGPAIEHWIDLWFARAFSLGSQVRLVLSCRMYFNWLVGHLCSIVSRSPCSTSCSCRSGATNAQAQETAMGSDICPAVYSWVDRHRDQVEQSAARGDEGRGTDVVWVGILVVADRWRCQLQPESEIDTSSRESAAACLLGMDVESWDVFDARDRGRCPSATSGANSRRPALWI